MQQFEQWAGWMLRIEIEDSGGHVDRATGHETRRLTFRYPSDPETFFGFLGEQVRSCVYRPTPAMLEVLGEYRDEIHEMDPETVEIYHPSEYCEGLEDTRVGYHFRIRFQWRDRWAGFGI